PHAGLLLGRPVARVELARSAGTGLPSRGWRTGVNVSHPKTTAPPGRPGPRVASSDRPPPQPAVTVRPRGSPGPSHNPAAASPSTVAGSGTGAGAKFTNTALELVDRENCPVPGLLNSVPVIAPRTGLPVSPPVAWSTIQL